MTSKPRTLIESDFPFDNALVETLRNIDTELLFEAIEEKERQKKAYVKQANETISTILKELKRRKRYNKL